MLHIFDINYTCNLKKDYENYIENINTENFICPNCKAKGRLSKHGHYERNIIIYENLEVREDKIKILRLICNSCKKTHAILPDFIIPYHVYTINLILSCLKDKFNLKQVKDICDKYQISFQLLYIWIKKFKVHQPLCEALFGQGKLTLKSIVEKILNLKTYSLFLKSYFNENLLFFMQNISSA